MDRRKYKMHDAKTGSAITVRVTPRAGRTMISGIMEDGTVKVKLAAAPVDGGANEELIHYLAAVLEISSSQLEIISGQSGRDKLVSIVGLDAPTVNERILKQIIEK